MPKEIWFGTFGLRNGGGDGVLSSGTNDPKVKYNGGRYS